MQEKLLVLREKNGLSKTNLADLLGLSLRTYSHKERGMAEFTQDEMFQLSCFFDKNIDEIFLPRSHHNGDKVTK